MVKLLSFCLVSLISFEVLASKADFCLEGTLQNIKNESDSSYMVCNVEQKLTWEDQTVLMNCDFEGYSASIFTQAAGIGSDLIATAWTDYSLYANNDLGRFLLKGLGLSQIKQAQFIRIMFFEDKLWARDEVIILESAAGIYKLQLTAKVGECSEFTPAL